MDDIKTKVIDLVSEQFDIPKENITDDFNVVTDIDLDSIEKLTFALTLEDTFDIEVPDADIASIQTVRDITNYINSKKTD